MIPRSNALLPGPARLDPGKRTVVRRQILRYEAGIFGRADLCQAAGK